MKIEIAPAVIEAAITDLETLYLMPREDQETGALQFYLNHKNTIHELLMAYRSSP